MSDEIIGALVNADVTYALVAGASHDDVAPRAEATIRSFIAATA